jgi:RNA polymerase sigma factor (sigma-70 family)
MEVSALKYSAGIGLHGRMPLLRLQSDERLIAFIRRGNSGAFEALVARYETRLLAFCRHLLGSREDAEDVLQEVLAAAFNAILADERPINVRPWLYRIARNRSLNHLRKIQAIGVDSMDTHFAEHGASTADKVHEREAFRLIVGDIHELPETQKTALVLREMDALSYEQIAEAMETTVPSVKSLLVRARVSLAEAAEARLLSCEEVRIELGEIAEGLRRRPTPLVRRHLRACKRCATFRIELRRTNKALAALMPVGPLLILKKLALAHLGHSAGAGSGAAGAGSGATVAGSGVAAAGSGAGAAGAAGSIAVGSTSGFVSAGLGAIATKAAAGLAAAALVTAGAVDIDHSGHRRLHRQAVAAAGVPAAVPQESAPTTTRVHRQPTTVVRPARRHKPDRSAKPSFVSETAAAKPATTPTTTAATTAPGRTSTQSDPTVLPPAAVNAPASPPPATASAPTASGSTPPSSDPASAPQSTSPQPTSPPPSTTTSPTPTGPPDSGGTPPTSTGPVPTAPPPAGPGDGSGSPGVGPGSGTLPGPQAPPSGAPPATTS